MNRIRGFFPCNHCTIPIYFRPDTCDLTLQYTRGISMRARKFPSDVKSTPDQKTQPIKLPFFNSKPSTDITEILKLIETNLPSTLSKKQKLDFANLIKEMWKNDSAKIISLTDEMEKFILQQKIDSKSSNQADSFGVTDFIKHIIKLMATAKFGALFLVSSAAGQAINSLFVNVGQPTGGTDLCSGVLFNIGCAQGYISNATSAAAPWSAPLPQFNRIISSVSGAAPDITDASYQQLRECVSITGNVGSAVIRAYESGSSNTLTTCTATSSAWYGYQAQASAVGGFTPASCLSLQGQLQNEFEQCKSLTGAALKAGAIAGIAIGGIAALALCVGALYYCKRNSECTLSNRI